MPIVKNLSGTVIATAAAAIFSGCVTNNSDTKLTANSQEAKVKCEGINSCNGSSDCRSATSSCVGRNHCAGEGWLYVDSVEDCETKGGTILDS